MSEKFPREAYVENFRRYCNYLNDRPCGCPPVMWETLELLDREGKNRGEYLIDEYGIPHCSECGTINNTVYRNYCPNCGAKMDGERNGDDNG